MAGKVVNSSFVLLSKSVANGQESASKTAASHIRCYGPIKGIEIKNTQ